MSMCVACDAVEYATRFAEVPEKLPNQYGEWSSIYLTLIWWNSLTFGRKVLPQGSGLKIGALNPSNKLVNFYQPTVVTSWKIGNVSNCWRNRKYRIIILVFQSFSV